MQNSVTTLETRRQLGAEMRPAIVSGMVTGDAPVSYWPVLSPDPTNSTSVFAKVNSIHFFFRF